MDATHYGRSIESGIIISLDSHWLFSLNSIEWGKRHLHFFRSQQPKEAGCEKREKKEEKVFHFDCSVPIFFLLSSIAWCIYMCLVPDCGCCRSCVYVEESMKKISLWLPFNVIAFAHPPPIVVELLSFSLFVVLLVLLSCSFSHSKLALSWDGPRRPGSSGRESDSQRNREHILASREERIGCVVIVFFLLLFFVFTDDGKWIRITAVLLTYPSVD